MEHYVAFAMRQGDYTSYSKIAERDIYNVAVPHRAMAFYFYDMLNGHRCNKSKEYIIGRFFTLEQICKLATHELDLIPLVKRVTDAKADGAIKCRNGLWVVHTAELECVDLP